MQSIALSHSRQKTVFKSETFSIDDQAKIIRGFLSVETKDLTGDIAIPEEFNLESYKKNPQVLFEHNLAVDEHGNKSSIGQCLAIEVVTIRDLGDPVYLSVVDSTGNVIDLFPRAKANGIGDGTRAVWCALEITNNLIWKRIKNGELTAFSWQGFCATEEQGDIKYLRDIDLLEISVVSMPCNRSSFFYVKSILLDSNEYDQERVLDFVDDHKFTNYSIYQLKNKWVISKSELPNIIEGKTERILDLDIILDSEKKMEAENDEKENKEETKVEQTTETEQVKVENVEVENLSVETFENFKVEQEKKYNSILNALTELSKKLSPETPKESVDIKDDKNKEEEDVTAKFLTEVNEVKTLLTNIQKNLIPESNREETIVKKDNRSEKSKKNDVFNSIFGLTE